MHSCYLSYLVFYELPGPMVWFLSLILGNSQPLLLQWFFLLFSFFFWYSHYVYMSLNSHNCWTVCSFFLILSFSSLYFSLVSFHWRIFQLTDSSLGHVHFTSEPMKSILQFDYSILNFQLCFYSFLVSIFCLRYPYIHACRPFFFH